MQGFPQLITNVTLGIFKTWLGTYKYQIIKKKKNKQYNNSDNKIYKRCHIRILKRFQSFEMSEKEIYNRYLKRHIPPKCSAAILEDCSIGSGNVGCGFVCAAGCVGFEFVRFKYGLFDFDSEDCDNTAGNTNGERVFFTNSTR